jgi:colicin import membrane protein
MNPVKPSFIFKLRHIYFLHGLRWRCLNGCLGALLLLAADFSVAQSTFPPSALPADAITPEGLVARYPTGSIQSSDMAKRALAEVDLQRATLDRKYAAQQHVCYTQFLATSCLDEAKESRRLALAQIRKVEVEANSFVRGARVVERDQRLAEKRANETRPKPVTEPNPELPAKHVEHSGDGDQRVARHEAKLREQQQAEKDNAPKRAEDIAAYEKKAKDAAARQHDVAAKKAEKERHAAAKAAADAAAASTAAASAPNKP